MKYFLITFIMILSLDSICFARGGGRSSAHISTYHSSGRAVRVHGYKTKSGHYVAPYYRTKADSTKKNNWSHKGNINPYTGKVGTKN